MPSKLKLDDKQQVVTVDGKPVYIHEDGREVPFDYDGTLANISRLTAESKKYRETSETQAAELKKYEGIDDPAAAKEAMKTVKNYKDKQLIDAGEAEAVKKAAIEATEAKYKPVVEEVEKLRVENREEKLGNAFGQSKFVAEKLTLPAPAARKLFGDHFEVKDGKILAKDAAGNPIFSKERAGEPANFDEAMAALVDAYPYKDNVLKGTGNRGDGKPGNGGLPFGGGGKTMTRAEYNKLTPLQQREAAVGKDKVTIVD